MMRVPQFHDQCYINEKDMNCLFPGCHGFFTAVTSVVLYI